jgi:hypothetical protein
MSRNQVTRVFAVPHIFSTNPSITISMKIVTNA